MTKRIATWLGVVAILGGVLGLGCFDSAEETQVAEEVGAFSDLLRFVPDEAEWRERVTMADLAAIREHYGLEQVGGADGMLEMQMVMGTDDLGLATVRAGILGAEAQYTAGAMDRWEVGFGFGFGEIDRTLTGGFGPPRNIYVAGGRFDAAGVEETLAGCGECEPHEEREYAGQRYLAWGDQWQMHLALREALPAFDHFGRGGLFVFTDEHVLRSNWAEDVEWMIDASWGDNSLGERAEFAEVAAAADELGLFALVLTDATQGGVGAAELIESFRGHDRFDDIEDAWTTDEGEIALRPYSVWGAGSGVDDEGAFTAVILAHSSEEAAAENVGRLEERLATGSSVWREQTWSEMFSKVAVSSDGAVLTAKLYGAGSVEGLLIEGMDPLLLHE